MTVTVPDGGTGTFWISIDRDAFPVTGKLECPLKFLRNIVKPNHLLHACCQLSRYDPASPQEDNVPRLSCGIPRRRRLTTYMGKSIEVS